MKGTASTKGLSISLEAPLEPVVSALPLVPAKWEYEIVHHLGNQSDQTRFNELGKQGFELVMIEKDTAYFKRPLSNFDMRI